MQNRSNEATRINKKDVGLSPRFGERGSHGQKSARSLGLKILFHEK